MSHVAIITDSTANFPEDLKQKYNIHTIPLKLHWDEQTLLDGIDITPSQFYQRLAKNNSSPTTSQPSPQDFLILYEKLAKDYDGILVLPISSGISGTYSSAITAAASFDKVPVVVIDTLTTAAGLVFMSLAAARALEQGASLQEAAQVAADVKEKIRVYFIVDTLTYLHRGGRIGGAARFFGTALSIKPILTMNGEGKINSLEQVRTSQKAIERILQMVKEHAGDKPTHLGVLHAHALKNGESLCKRICDEINVLEYFISEIGPVIGAHTGPGTLGIFIYTD